LVDQTQLLAGTHTTSLLKEFLNAYEGSDPIASELADFLVDAAGQPPNVRNFYVDRIIDHRAAGRSPPCTDNGLYTPGAAGDNCPPMESLFDYASPFLGADFRDVLLDETGIFRFGDAIEHPVDDAPKKPPDKVEFLVKWQGLPEEQATWENPDSLMTGHPFSIANPVEFDRLVAQYWSHVDRTTQTAAAPGRLHFLTADQRTTVDGLLRMKDMKQSVALLGKHGCGRVASVCAFLEMCSRSPNLVLVNANATSVWVKALRELTSLVWVEYAGDPQNRATIRNHEFRTKSRFDVLITTDAIFAQDSSFIRSFEWGNVVIDVLHGECRCDASSFQTMTIHLSFAEIPRAKSIWLTSSPIRRQENLVFCANIPSPFIHNRLKSLLKSKTVRADSLRASPQIFREILRLHVHPALVPCSSVRY
jgi:hypothetical protein